MKPVLVFVYFQHFHNPNILLIYVYLFRTILTGQDAFDLKVYMSCNTSDVYPKIGPFYIIIYSDCIHIYS